MALATVVNVEVQPMLYAPLLTEMAVGTVIPVIVTAFDVMRDPGVTFV